MILLTHTMSEREKLAARYDGRLEPADVADAELRDKLILDKVTRHFPKPKGATCVDHRVCDMELWKARVCLARSRHMIQGSIEFARAARSIYTPAQYEAVKRTLREELEERREYLRRVALWKERCADSDAYAAGLAAVSRAFWPAGA